MSDNTAFSPPSTTAPRRLTRRRDGKMIAGVSTGLADYLGVDPVVVRVGFVVTTILSGAGILLYLACWILMPRE